MKVYNGRLYFLSIVVGILTGIITVPYRYLLTKADTFREIIYPHNTSLYYHLIALALIWLIAMGVNWLCKKYPLISGSGIPQAKGVINERIKYKHPFKMLCAKFAGGLASIGIGMSLGREGPSVQIGTFIAQITARFIKITPTQLKYLISGGASAGLAAAFTAPLAAVIFMIEEVEKFVSPKITITALLSSIAAGYFAQRVFTLNPFAAIPVAIPQGGYMKLLLLLFLLSVFCAFIGKIFNQLLLYAQLKYKTSKIPVSIKILFVITTTYVLALTLPDLVAGGENYFFKEAMSSEGNILFLLFIIALKLLFTVLCYATGFPGGIFLPLLVIGGLTGKAFALLMIVFGLITPAQIGYFSLIGMALCFIAVVRSPITGLILLLEMTGEFALFVPMIIAGGITYFVSELMKTRPVYDLLYQRLFYFDPPGKEENSILNFDVNEASYLMGKKVQDIRLPKECKIIAIQRNGMFLQMPCEATLQADDILQIRVKTIDQDALYIALRSLANE